jgi:hypothetical protein
MGEEDLSPARIFPSSLSPTTLSIGDCHPRACTYKMIVDKELLDTIRDLSNQYAMTKFGTSYNISSEEINIFFGILLPSGYNTVTDYTMYWSNSEYSENKMVKGAMPRDRFMTIKKCIHFGIIEDKEGETPDRYKKVRLLIKHMQKKFAEMFVPEQNMTRP